MVQIRRIICPVDFSEVSRHAFDRALAVAQSYGSAITVLHVLPTPSHVPAVPYGPEGPGPFGFEVPNRLHVLSELSRFLHIEHPRDVAIHQEVIEAGVADADRQAGIGAELPDAERDRILESGGDGVGALSSRSRQDEERVHTPHFRVHRNPTGRCRRCGEDWRILCLRISA